MDKAQIKPRKDKKKNTETGLLMGQNANIFSQLSATYLQNKQSHTEEEQHFVKSTKIVEYHDPKINRLIALLRKKADVTKAKAASQLRQQFQQMTQENLEQFLPTFAQLFLQSVINEQSKQVTDQFINMLNYLLAKNKRLAIKEISTLYGPFLIINRSINISASKSYAMLFTGSDHELYQKALTLLLKKQIFRKFIIFCKTIIECEQSHKIGLQNYQRNCAALMKVIKDFINNYNAIIDAIKKDEPQKAENLDEGFKEFILQLDEILIGKFIDEYFKVGGKGKAAILQLYQSLIRIVIKNPQWKIIWEKYGKCLCQHFLDKDIVVQQSLWKHCNRQFLDTCLLLEKTEQVQPYSTFIKYLPKPEDKLLTSLKLGGLTLYKQLPNYCVIFPSTTFSKIEPENHKSLINKINFIRKLMNTLLTQLEDENQARIQCYYQLAKYFIQSFRGIIFAENIEQKKLHEIKQLLSRTEKQIIENVQNKFYQQPPISRNSFTFYIPTFFCKLLEELKPTFEFQFNPESTFPLYKQLAVHNQSQYNQEIFEKIYCNCKQNKKLLLSYLETFPRKSIKINLGDGNEDPQTSAKIFLLSLEAQNFDNWFQQNWDLRITAMIYDPRITINDLNSFQQSAQERNMQNLYFNPTIKQLPSQFDVKKYDQIRIEYFIKCISSEEQINMIPLLLPLFKQKLLHRNKDQGIQNLLKIFDNSQRKLREKKWIIGVSEVLRVRTILDIIVQSILFSKNNGIKPEEYLGQQHFTKFIRSLCLFAFIIYSYKLEEDSQEILKLVNKLTYLHDKKISELIFESIQQSIKQCYNTFKSGSQKSSLEDRQRRNRLNRCLGFIQKLLWHCMGNTMKNQNQKYFVILEDVLRQQGWREADCKSDLWEIFEILLVKVNNNEAIKNTIVDKIVRQNIGGGHYQKFLAHVLCCQLLLSLQRHPETKRVFLELQDNILHHIQKNCNDQQKLIILKNIISEALQDQSMTIIYGCKSLLKNLLKQYQDLQAITLLSYLKECLNRSISTFESFDGSEKSILSLQRSTLLSINLISELPLLDIPEIEKVYDQFAQKFHKQTGLLFLAYHSILAVFWQGRVGVQKVSQEDIQNIINKSLQIYTGQQHQAEKHKNFYRLTLLTLFNVIYSLKGSKPFEKFEQTIMKEIIWPNINQSSMLHGALQSSRLQYISKIFSTSSIDLKKEIMRVIPDEMLTDLNSYKQILDTIENDQQDSTQVHHYENIIAMFIQSAQILIKIAEELSPGIHPKEEAILGLLQCPFAGVKRTAFILLKRMYELKIVQKLPPKEFLQFLRSNKNFQKYQLDTILANQISKYLYSWQAIIYRRGATEQRVQEQEYNMSLQDYLQQVDQNSNTPQQLYEDFLKASFYILQNHLEYTKNQEQFYEVMSPEDLSSDDTMIIIEDDMNLRQKIYRLSMKSLFLFIMNFPLFLRQFMDKNKKYKNVCDRILKNLVSDAIFKQEITRIQIREPEWKASGNFDIYVTSKNKQIYAEYTHDVIRIGLRLVMKSNFPITPITIEFGDGLKLDEGSRWALMLQSQLHNKNNTIINGILLWKQNIDKKLAGVEECAICFDIVNSVGFLPKKGCKTCKKRFHSSCVMKWFNKSNKSECPLCKSQFL